MSAWPQRRSPTIDHAEDDLILVHADFLPLMEEILPLVKRDVQLILLNENSSCDPKSSLEFITSYDAMMAQPVDHFEFPEFDERLWATTSIQQVLPESQKPWPIRIANWYYIRWGFWQD